VWNALNSCAVVESLATSNLPLTSHSPHGRRHEEIPAQSLARGEPDRQVSAERALRAGNMPLTRHDYARQMHWSPEASVRTFTHVTCAGRLSLRHRTVRGAV
jgi:hypothetical protein